MANKQLFRIYPYTTEEFIQKARELYGDKYDYRKVNLENNPRKVSIICTKCGGVIQVSPQEHLNGIERHRCAMTEEIFLEKAREVHGDKYDYSRMNFKGPDVEVEIICPIHGAFWKKPKYHILGSGCPRCSSKFVSHKTEDVKERIRAKYGDRYDLSLVDYKGCHTPICLICHEKDEHGIEHGPFWMTTINLLSHGQGCPICGNKEKIRKTRERGRDIFIRKARKIHGDKYDYSEMDYHGLDTRVKIICPNCGPFWMVPKYHLAGHGCPNCKKVNMTKANFLKTIEEKYGGKYVLKKSSYMGLWHKTTFTCPVHGEVTMSAQGLLDYGCVLCRREEAMERCDAILDREGMAYEHDKTFYWSEGGSYDYYLPEYNTIIQFIERAKQRKANQLCEEHFVTVRHVLLDDGYEEEFENMLQEIKESVAWHDE